MDWLYQLFDHINHLDYHFKLILTNYGSWAYLILFSTIFAETGLIITSFLPGDSLLFAVGIIARQQESGLNIWLLFGILCAAAILGNTANYYLARFIGKKLFEIPRFNKYQSHVEETHKLFDKYGGWALILARFVPFARAIAPFVVGLGKMSTTYFQIYNFIGGILWVGLLLFSGYFVGQSQAAQNHTVLILIALVLVAFLGILFKFVISKFRKQKLIHNEQKTHPNRLV